MLQHLPKKAAPMLVKALKSAVANAENTQRVDVDQLYVKRIMVDGGADREALPAARPRARHAAAQAHRSPHHRRRRAHGALGASMGQKVHPKGFRLGVIESERLEVVRAPRVSRAAARGSQAAQVPQGAPLPRRDLEGRDRARRQQGQDQHLYRAARASSSARRAPRSRSSRRELAQADQEGVVHQHPRGAPSRPRRAAGGRERRPAARAPRRLPPRHEGSGRPRHAHGRAGHQGAMRRPPRRRRDRARANGTARGACRCTRCAPTSATAWPKRRPPTA